jgi:16S rRNA pseudouridine516 synthase
VEGRYHQVKRMLAAVGNHVALLHRSSIGNYVMPDDLKEGQWRWIDPQEIALLAQPIE